MDNSQILKDLQEMGFEKSKIELALQYSNSNNQEEVLEM